MFLALVIQAGTVSEVSTMIQKVWEIFSYNQWFTEISN